MSKIKKEKDKIIKQNFSGVAGPDKPCIIEFELPENAKQTKLSFKTKKIKEEK